MATEIISRAEARARGLKHYFTGKPCIRGHIETRRTKSGQCKTCCAEDRKDWGLRNAERLQKYLRDWHVNNPGRAKQLNADWNEKNKQRQINKRRGNAEVLRQKTREWAKRNPEICALWARNRRALKKSRGTHTVQDIEELLVKQSFKCVYCNVDISKKYHVDHMMPLKRGGSNEKANLQILCRRCNQTKHAKDPIEFAKQLGMLL